MLRIRVLPGAAVFGLLCACGGGGGMSAPASYTIGGSVSGLASGDSVVLADNGADLLTVTANGPFTFKSPVARNGTYNVTVATNPTRQACTVSMGAGSAVAANLTNVKVVCAALTKTWVLTGSMSVARASFGAVLLPDGDVLVAGGLAGGWYQVDSGTTFVSINSSAELYNFTTGVWTATGGMSAARQSFTATLLSNGTVLAAGGYIWTAPPTNRPESLSAAEIYDPAQHTWSATAPMTMARSGHTATLLPNGTVLVAGGDAVGNSAEIYDPASGTWTPTGNLVTARSNHTATLLPDGTVLVAGGSAWYGATNNSEIYDPSTGLWAPTAYLTAGRSGHTATLLPNGTVLAAGGDAVGNSAEIYDPASGTWAPTGNMTTGRSNQTATLLPDGTVLVAGGNYADGESAEIYVPSSGTWIPTGNMNAPNSNQIAILLPNGTVLVAGGGGVSGYPGYQPPTSAEIYLP